MFKVVAADIYTGTILNVEFEWYSNVAETEKLELNFKTLAAVKLYCSEKLVEHPNIEFWVTSSDGNKEVVTLENIEVFGA